MKLSMCIRHLFLMVFVAYSKFPIKARQVAGLPTLNK